MESDAELLDALVFHTTLPPNAPHQQDKNLVRVEDVLGTRFLEACKEIRDLTCSAHNEYRTWESLRISLQGSKRFVVEGRIDQASLLAQLEQLQDSQSLILYISEQNAGVLIYKASRPDGVWIVFETFEASTTSAQALSVVDASTRSFPGSAVELPLAVYEDQTFQDALADELDRMSSESVKRFAAKKNKDGTGSHEIRETPSPELVSGWLMSLLEAWGRKVEPSIIEKRLYDEVLWHDAEMPWRRSGFWIVLRVGSERHLLNKDAANGRVLYKFLLVIFFAQLLRDSISKIPEENVVFLRKKLSSRIAKLHIEKATCALPESIGMYNFYFSSLEGFLSNTIAAAEAYTKLTNTRFRNHTTQLIPPLPRTVLPQELQLELRHSSAYIRRVQNEAPVPRHDKKIQLARAVGDDKDSFIKKFRSFADYEKSLSGIMDSQSSLGFQASSVTITRFGSLIQEYINKVGSSFDKNPARMSSMLLLIMEMWVIVDRAAKLEYPLLGHFPPPFPSNILDVLRPTHLEDLERLNAVGDYLESRWSARKPGYGSIFSLRKNCFAAKFWDATANMQSTDAAIKRGAEVTRAETKKEWEDKDKEWRKCNLEHRTKQHYNDKTQQFFENHWEKHNRRTCTKCQLFFQMKNLDITIHEWPLVQQKHVAKATVFELCAPQVLLKYRDVTAKILRRLAFRRDTDAATSRDCHVTVRSYEGLQDFGQGVPSSVTLGSTTKSEYQTHRRRTGFPVALESICVESNLSLAYLDTSDGNWWVPNLEDEPATFAHHFGDDYLSGTPLESLLLTKAFAINGPGPMSNDVLASQVACPANIGQREWTAFQMLFSGFERRWPQILLELGSSDLNFSSDVVVSLVERLILQAGPSNAQNVLRIAHQPMTDPGFRRSLCDQLLRRLHTLSTNWRETIAMRLIVSLALRLCAVPNDKKCVSDGYEVLRQARMMLSQWIRELRTKHSWAADQNSAASLSRYLFDTALLCKRTFMVFTFSSLADTEVLSAEDVQCFVESSITVFEQLNDAPTTLPQRALNALADDSHLGYYLEPLLYHSLITHKHAILQAIMSLWPGAFPQAGRITYDNPRFLPPPNQDWLQMFFETNSTFHVKFNYHPITGCALINETVMSKLPDDLSRHPVLQELFGRQSFQTVPSGVIGMTYQLRLGTPEYGVHLGFRGDLLVVRLVSVHKQLEFVPRSTFGPSDAGDLPLSLLEDCVHWLNIATGEIEIRPKARVFEYNADDWVIDTKKRSGFRGSDGSYLVEQTAQTHQSIARVFTHFERACNLVVLKKSNAVLSVELPRVELTFSVNNRSLLNCEQLHGELQPLQDCGTWYGLHSKLVLQDTVNPRHKTVIVPLGKPICKRNGAYVEVTIQNYGPYVKFTVNQELQRLDSPPEPTILYTKALLHALTSCLLPDELTGMTGTEAALRCLNSAAAMPHAPLRKGPETVLEEIATLTPKRYYYPVGKKVQQTVRMNPNMPFWTQNEEFHLLVEQIHACSNDLARFTPGSSLLKLPEKYETDDHLSNRAASRRSRLEVSTLHTENAPTSRSVFLPRDTHKPSSKKRANVFECASLLHKWKEGFRSTKDLAAILQQWSTVAGFQGQEAPHALSDRFSLRLYEAFGSLIETCRNSTPTDKYRLGFLLSPFCYYEPVDMGAVRALIAIAVSTDLKAIEPPNWPIFEAFTSNTRPTKDKLVVIIESLKVPFKSSIEVPPGMELSQPQKRKLDNEKQQYSEQVASACSKLANSIIAKGSRDRLLQQSWPTSPVLQTSLAFEAADREWKRLHANYDLSQYISSIQSILDAQDQSTPLPSPPKIRKRKIPPPSASRPRTRTSLSTLLRMPHSKIPPAHLFSTVPGSIGSIKNAPQKAVNDRSTSEIEALERLVHALDQGASNVRSTYASDLTKSINALRCAPTNQAFAHTSSASASTAITILDAQIAAAQKRVKDIMVWMLSELQARHSASKWLLSAGLWPSVNVGLVLAEMRSESSDDLGAPEKEMLAHLGLAVNALQRLKRIYDAEKRGAYVKAKQEHLNTGHTNWSPLEYPDWLLIELDSNVTIREEQVEVAKATIDPPSQQNSCLQLNMGGGKSSVILPMCASVLANRKQLVRVVVPRALLVQSSQVMQTKMGGLLDRPIRHVPYSRRTEDNMETVQAYSRLHEEILKRGGVMLCLPEHMLSFKLSGHQRLADDKIETGKRMVKMQDWLGSNARDLIDECDEILSTKQQLVFPSGAQLAVDGHPFRWEVIEELLYLSIFEAQQLNRSLPHSLDVVFSSETTFPIMHFLRKDAEAVMTDRLVEGVCRGGLRSLPIDKLSKADVNSIRIYLKLTDVSKTVSKDIKDLFPDNPAARNTIYLLRGLLTYGILIMTLKRRWNVQYGLHPTRAPISVPFHAKGSPSEQAEWGHPDVSLLFTCLSFFYGGLTVDQLKQALDHLITSDDPASEYNTWIEWQHNVPPALSNWSHVNTGDSLQLQELWSYLRVNQPAIKYFLNRFVFPVHAKQFSVKLQASGWDLPQFPTTQQPSVARYTPLTTGFSGTNDQRDLLPLTIKQNDLGALLKTNAEVLTALLEPRNRGYIPLRNNAGGRLSEPEILKMLTSKKIPILIDAGAVIVETTNRDLAIMWLTIWPSAPAAVYFDNDGKASVQYRGGTSIPLLASPYAEDLSTLLVFIDHQHCRGVDLKFPVNAKGAVTLSLGQTKDHSIQAAMRLRQLQISQSICWLAPPEVDQSITDAQAPGRNGELDSYDVVWWLLEQSCRSIEQSLPLFTVQGETFCEQVQAKLENPEFAENTEHREEVLKSLHQVERQTLENLYDPATQERDSLEPDDFSLQLRPLVVRLGQTRHSFQSSGVFHSGAMEEVEQEREVTAEAEVVRQLQEASDFVGVKPEALHEHIKQFIVTGSLPDGSEAFTDMFTAMSHTTVGKRSGITAPRLTFCALLVSREYQRTLAAAPYKEIDNFIRPANWLLVSPRMGQGLLVSPEEAEEILPFIRSLPSPKAHLVLYSAPVTRKMRVFEKLNFYAVPALPRAWIVPRQLQVMLGIYAGFLYFDYDTFVYLRKYLAEIAIVKPPVGSLGIRGAHIARPLAFFKAWLDVRRKGQEFYETPAGFISLDKDLELMHRFFRD